MSPSGIYASSASRRQHIWGRRRRRARLLLHARGGLLLAWAPAPVLAAMLAERWLG